MKNIKTIYLGLCLLFSALIHAQQTETISFIQINQQIENLLEDHIYNPKELESLEYKGIQKKLKILAETVKTETEFINGFNALWKNGPFSHISVQKSQHKASEMAHYIDHMKVGNQGASLRWENTVPVLQINTMMGVDTYQFIENAFETIISKNPKNLIIDLRNNTGGTFAIVPLVGSLIEKPVDAGFFLSQNWWKNNNEIPKPKDIKKLEPWKGWSIASFWNDVQQNGVTRVQFLPAKRQFKGKVYVLMNHQSASATEFALDVLSRLKNVTLIGETSAGEMLSQKMYDLPNGLQLSLPIAEYYSSKVGKIEGKGITPDIKVNSEKAFLTVLDMIKY